MSHVIAGCGSGVSQSCSQYAGSSWSPGAFVLLTLILIIIFVVVMLARRGR